MLSQTNINRWTDDKHYEINYSLDLEQNIVIRNVEFNDGRNISSSLPIAKIGESPKETFDISYLMCSEKPEPKGNGPIIRLCDLFSGCGGISVGIDEAARSLGMRVEHVLAWDIFEEARLTYAENFDTQHIRGDPIEQSIDGGLGEELTTNEAEFLSMIGDVDFVVGGPPCQGFSVMGDKNSSDPRNELCVAPRCSAERSSQDSAIFWKLPGPFCFCKNFKVEALFDRGSYRSSKVSFF